MKKITLLMSFLMLLGWQVKAQFGCGSGVVISNGYTQSGITTPGTGGIEDWNINPTGTSVNASYWDDDVYLFEYTAGATAEQISMTIFTRSSWNGIGIFDDCIGTTFSNELDADASTGGNVSHVVTATIAAGNTVYIAVGQWGTPNNLDFDVTNFTVTQILCPDPTALNVANITTTSADLAWTENGTATQWDIEYGATPFTPTGVPTISGTITNPHNLNTLTPSTSYDFYVRADCGGSGTSSWVGPFNFTTACTSVIAPWNEAFENGGTIPSCWNQGVSNSENWLFANTASGKHVGNNGVAGGATTSGNYFSWIDDSTPDNTGTTLESPFIDVSGLTVPELSFFLISNNETHSNVNFSVDVWDGAAWNVGVYTHNTNTLNGEWEKILVSFSSLTITGDIKLRFIVDEPSNGDFYDDIAIDDVDIHEAPACPAPSALVATNILGSSADLGWTENGSATLWDIELGLANFTPTGVPTITGTATNPHNVTGLSPTTSYDFYVRADCGVDSSLWVGPFNFTTGCLSQLAGTYTIGATGNYPNFTAAVAALSCGISAPVIFNVLPGSGPFNEQITITPVTGASATNTITFNGNGETITSTTLTASRSLILLDGANHITFDSLNLVTQSTTNNFAIQLTNGADSNTINNCTVDLTSAITSTSTTNAGIVISGSLTSATSTTQPTGNYNTITNNTVVGGYYAITLAGANNNIVSNNNLQDFYSYGIYHNAANNNEVKNNSISRPSRTSITTFNGIYYTGSGENNLAEANEIFNPMGGNTTSTSAIYPIYHTGVDATVGNENKVINNIIHSINGNGTIYGLYNSSSDGVFYYHNTISLDDVNATSGTTRGFYQLTTATGIELKNNIITITRSGSGTKYCVYFGAAASIIASDYNVFYINAPAGTNNLGYFSAAQATLSAWQTASSQDANSFDVDPIYVNILVNDLTPANATIDGVATATVGITNDFYGVARAVTPDPGAIEFTPPSCAQPSSLTTINITATSADLGWTENGTATMWDIEIDTAGFTPTGVPTVAGTMTNPHNYSGLTAQTSYDFYVRADCGGPKSAWSGPYTFTTACLAVIAPWTDSVETHATSLLITTSNCWTATSVSPFDWNIDDNGSTPSPGTGPLGAHSGVKYFYTEASSGATGDVATLTTPFIDITALTNPIIEYYYHMYGSGLGMGDLFVDVYDGVSWTVVDSLIGEQHPTQASPWSLRNVDISAFSGTIQVRFRGRKLAAQYGDISLDDISVKEAPACPFPSNLTAINVTATSADLGWTENGTATMWDIEYGITPFTPTGVPTITGTTTNPHNLTGLTANTSYDFYVRADCGLDSSIWVGPFNFTTPCATYIAPYLEQFNVPSLPACWSQSGATTWEYGSVTGTTPAGFADYGANTVPDHSTPATGTFIGMDGSDNTDGEVSILLSPFIDASPLTAPHLSYWVFSNNINDAAQNKLIVELWDGTAWNFIDSIQANLGANWVNYDTILTSLSITGDVQVRFTLTGVANGGSTYYNDILIDDVQIYEPLANDVGVISIASAPAGCGLGMETVTVKVKNYGTVAQSGFDVVYSLNGVPVTPETVIGSVLPGDTLTHVFTTLANMSTPNNYTINAWSLLTTDGNNANDTLNGWMTEHVASSLTFNGNDTIHNALPNGSNTIVCTNGLVNNMLDTCYRLSALVIDSLMHTWNSDLDIWLISPAGDTLEISTDNGGSTDNYINVTFTDTAATNINGNNPVPGFYHTEELVGLYKFNGTNPEGAWTLKVVDDAGGDNGNLFKWHLEFTDYNFVVDLGADSNACSVDVLTFDAGVGNYSYAWSTGDSTQQITVDTTSLGGNGTYNISVVVTDLISGCESTDTVVVNYSACVGIDAVANNVNMNVYPNPNNGEFTLNINTTDINELDVKVMNIQGQVVYAKNNYSNITNINEKINLSDNANGIYFIVITTDKGIVTHKLVIQ